jgi:hypothetical protein
MFLYKTRLRFEFCQIYKHKRITTFIIDKTVYQIGTQHFCWLWLCIKPVNSSVLGIYISEERNMLVIEKFIISLIEKYAKYIEFTQI